MRTLNKQRQWLDDIDTENPTDEDHKMVEDMLNELEQSVEQVREAEGAIRQVDTFYEHVGRNAKRDFESAANTMAEWEYKYTELLEDARETFQAIDDELYG